MPEDGLDLLIAEEVDRHRPPDQPPFEALAERWRRRRATRRTASVTAVVMVVAAAIAVPAALLHRSGGHAPRPPAATGAVSPSPSRPTGRIPWDVTGVTACHDTDCRTIVDPRQIAFLVDDLNVSEVSTDPPDVCRMGPQYVVTLTFTGPHEPYPVADVITNCVLWSIRGEPQRYDATRGIRETAEQAQRLGIVAHDCGVTGSTPQAPYELATEYVGLTLDEAQSLATQLGMTVRVRGQDGVCGPSDEILLPQWKRVNVYVEHGRVTSARRF